MLRPIRWNTPSKTVRIVSDLDFFFTTRDPRLPLLMLWVRASLRVRRDGQRCARRENNLLLLIVPKMDFYCVRADGLIPVASL